MKFSHKELEKIIFELESQLDLNLADLQHVTNIEQFIMAMANGYYRANYVENMLRQLLSDDTSDNN